MENRRIQKVAISLPSLGLVLLLIASLLCFSDASSSLPSLSQQKDTASNESGLIFLIPSAGTSWNGVCDGSSCNESDPCQFPSGSIVEIQQSNCMLVFADGNYAGSHLSAKTSSADGNSISVAFQGAIANLNLSLLSSPSAEVSSYQPSGRSIENRVTITNSAIRFEDVTHAFISYLIAQNSQFTISLSDLDTPTTSSVTVWTSNSTFLVGPQPPLFPATEGIFNFAINSSTVSTHIVGFNIQASAAISPNVFIQSPVATLDNMYFQNSSISGFDTIARINITSSTAMPAGFTFKDSELKSISTLVSLTSIGSTSHLMIESTKIHQPLFDREAGEFTRLFDQGTQSISIKNSDFQYVSINCESIDENEPIRSSGLHRLSTTSIDFDGVTANDCDFCLIGIPPNAAKNSTSQPMLSIGKVYLSLSEHFHTLGHRPNITIANVNFLPKFLELQTNASQSTPFNVKGQVETMYPGIVQSNGLYLHPGARYTAAVLILSNALTSSSGSVLTSRPPNIKNNGWNITSPIKILSDASGTGAIDFSYVHVNFFVTFPPATALLNANSALTMTNIGGPSDLLSRIHIQSSSDGKIEPKKIYPIGRFEFNELSVAEAYASAPLLEGWSDPYVWMGSARPVVASNFNELILSFSVPQSCPLPAPSFQSLNSTQSKVSCDTATGNWRLNGNLDTSEKSFEISCWSCQLLVLGNLTFGSGQLLFRRMSSTMLVSQYVNIKQGHDGTVVLFPPPEYKDWTITPIVAGFSPNSLDKVKATFDYYRSGCKFWEMTRKQVSSNELTLYFHHKNECIIPIAVGVSLGVAFIIVITTIIVCCCFCKEKRPGYQEL